MADQNDPQFLDSDNNLLVKICRRLIGISGGGGVTQAYVDAGDAASVATSGAYADATFVRIDGGSVMTGDLDLGVNLIHNVVDPVALQDAATKNYVDTQVTAVTPPFSDAIALVKGSGDPTKLLQFEVDGFSAGTTRTITVPNVSSTMEVLSNKDAASGYAGLTAGTKLNLAQAQEVIALSDLTDVTTVGVTKGNLLAASGATWDDLAVGADGEVLTADSVSALGVKWATAATGAPFVDTTAIVKGSGDPTKLLRFEVDGFTTATTRVLTPPNEDGTIEITAHKNAASGYAGLTAGTKLNLAQMQEVMGLSDLTDVTTVTATKGDLLVADGSVFDDLAVGTNNQILIADSAQTLGVKWGTLELSARVFHSAAQSIANNTQTALAFDSERFDNGGFHDNSTNNTRLTFPLLGRYFYSANIQFPDSAVGSRAIIIRLNGTTIIQVHNITPITGTTTSMAISGLYEFGSGGDYIECLAFQTSGGALNVNSAANFSPEFAIFKVN